MVVKRETRPKIRQMEWHFGENAGGISRWKRMGKPMDINRYNILGKGIVSPHMFAGGRNYRHRALIPIPNPACGTEP